MKRILLVILVGSVLLAMIFFGTILYINNSILSDNNNRLQNEETEEKVNEVLQILQEVKQNLEGITEDT